MSTHRDWLGGNCLKLLPLLNQGSVSPPVHRWSESSATSHEGQSAQTEKDSKSQTIRPLQHDQWMKWDHWLVYAMMESNIVHLLKYCTYVTCCGTCTLCKNFHFLLHIWGKYCAFYTFLLGTLQITCCIRDTVTYLRYIKRPDAFQAISMTQ